MSHRSWDSTQYICVSPILLELKVKTTKKMLEEPFVELASALLRFIANGKTKLKVFPGSRIQFHLSETFLCQYVRELNGKWGKGWLRHQGSKWILWYHYALKKWETHSEIGFLLAENHVCLTSDGCNRVIAKFTDLFFVFPPFLHPWSYIRRTNVLVNTSRYF